MEEHNVGHSESHALISFSTVGTLLLASMLLLYLYLTRNFGYWTRKRIPSYPNPYPLFGHFKDVFTFNVTIGELFKKVYEAFPEAPCVGMYIVDKPTLLVRSPDLVKDILVKDFSSFSDRNACLDESNDPVAAHFLFLMKNPEWKYSRAKLSPIFSSGKMKTMFLLMNEAALDMNEYLVNKGPVIDSREVCAKYTTDVIVSTVFGLKANSFHDEDALFRGLGKEMFKSKMLLSVKQFLCFLAPSIANFFRLKFFDRNFYDFITVQFLRVFEERKQSGRVRNDLIDIFVKFESQECDSNGMKFDKHWLLGQAVNFYGAGFETSSSIMSYTLYEMCCNPEVQTKLRREIHSKYPTRESITYDTLTELKYLHAVVSESLRKYPVAQFIDRKCLKKYFLSEYDTYIEEGTPICVPIMGLHFDPEYFPNPAKYDPERFNDENKNSFPTCAYVPFGTGPHNCIGERFAMVAVKLGLIHFLYDFEVVATKDTPKNIAFDTYQLISCPLNELRMEIRKCGKNIV